MKKICMATIISVGLFLSGCASIVGNSSESILVNTNTDNAELTVKNRSGMVVYKGSLPATVLLPKKSSYFSGETYYLFGRKKGKMDQTLIADTRLSGWYWGNILFGGLIGMLIVDPLTGAMWTFDNNQLFLYFDK